MKHALMVLIPAVLASLSACGGSSGPQTISVAITAAPQSLATNATANVAARVSHDAANAGVTWSCTPAGACGSFNPASTASNANSTYTAPAAIPGGGSVTVTATSVTDTTKSASAVITIVPPISNATLKGQYAFLLSAPTGNAGVTWLAGSVTLDGAGKVTAGVGDGVAPTGVNAGDAIVSGTYAIDPNGHGTMTFTTKSSKIVKCSLAVTSTSHALIAEVDGNPASGTLDLQSAGPGFTMAQFSGGYSFTLSGKDSLQLTRIATGGDFVADGAGRLNNGTFDVNIDGVLTSSFLSGTFTAPDSNGRGTATLSSGIALAYYLVTPEAVRLIETDGVQILGGSAYGQGTGTFSNSSMSGNFVLQQGGWTSSGRTMVIGQITANGAGSITTGLADSNADGAINTAMPVSGTYSFSNSPLGVLTLAGANFTGNAYLVDPKVNILDPNHATGGGGALLLQQSASIVGTGVLIPQTASGAAFLGNHALSLTNSVHSPSNESDLVGVFTSDGVANFAGAVDYDENASVNPAAMLGVAATGTFAADGAHAGHFTGTFTIPTPAAGYPFVASSNTIHVSFYQASSSQALVLETDTAAESWGVLEQQQVP